MKCQVFWRYANGALPSTTGCAADATYLVIGSALDNDWEGHIPYIFAVCEEHADIGAKDRWTKIHPNIAKHIGKAAKELAP